MDFQYSPKNYRHNFKLDKYGFLSGKAQKENYYHYQNEYFNLYGVRPELDLIRNPYYAISSEVDDFYQGGWKKTAIDALQNPDICNRFKKKFVRILEKYEKEFSFLTTRGFINFKTEIENMEVGTKISEEVGYLKDADGNYYEGTWKNNRLQYGLMYSVQSGVLFIGTFFNDSYSRFDGVAAFLSEDGELRIAFGTQNIYENVSRLDADEAMVATMDLKTEKGIIVIGKYINGYEEGKMIAKNMESGEVDSLNYQDGEIKTAPVLCALGAVLRWFLGWYMLLFYMMYYVYFFIFLIHLGVKKSKKKKAAKKRFV